MLSRQKRRQRQFQCAGRSKRLQYEKMESRRLLAVIPVAPGDENLRAAIVAADSNSDASNTLQLSAGDYTISDYSSGNLLVQNTSGLAQKTLIIAGAGPNNTVIEPSVSDWHDRIMEVVGSVGAGMTVELQGIQIFGGMAVDSGVLGGDRAIGGGILIVGANVTLDNTDVFSNQAVGPDGTAGAGNRDQYRRRTTGTTALSRRAAEFIWPVEVSHSPTAPLSTPTRRPAEKGATAAMESSSDPIRRKEPRGFAPASAKPAIRERLAIRMAGQAATGTLRRICRRPEPMAAIASPRSAKGARGATAGADSVAASMSKVARSPFKIAPSRITWQRAAMAATVVRRRMATLKMKAQH